MSSNDPGTDSGSDSGGGGVYLQDLWFIVLGVFVVIFIVMMWARGRRRKATAARRTQSGRYALSQDVERMGWTMPSQHSSGWRMGRRTTHREEGLDETGEAPPAYNEVGDDKPPSITTRVSSDAASPRSHEGREPLSGANQRFELQPPPLSYRQPQRHTNQLDSTSPSSWERTPDMPLRPPDAVLAT